jgi:hypothetical protein
MTDLEYYVSLVWPEPYSSFVMGEFEKFQSLIPCWRGREFFQNLKGCAKNVTHKNPRASVLLKGLSQEIDFKNFDKNLQNLAYLWDAACF